jgi:hypothetical protein
MPPRIGREGKYILWKIVENYAKLWEVEDYIIMQERGD